QLGLTAAAPRVREELKHPVPEVRLAAIWALGCLRDDGAKEALVQMLRSLGPTPGESHPLSEGDGGVQLLSDAEGRLFDATVQALSRLSQGEGDPVVLRAVADARARVRDDELDRPVRLPTFEETAPAGMTLRQLFDGVLAAADDDELGC
ncbi:MAG TPA: HEAT repeat domain-containing protein, partial [Thermoplasmata archaeon]|nr:HEAT repeat domain-containing protein [Thermoplasmata archaeon]